MLLWNKLYLHAVYELGNTLPMCKRDCPCPIGFLVAWRYENKCVNNCFILQLCYTCWGKKVSRTYLRCFINLEFSSLWSSVEFSLLSSFCPPFYENKAVLPKHGEGFTFHTDFIFFLRDYIFFAHFLKQKIQKDHIPPMNQKRKPMRLNASDPKSRMQLCKAGQEHINLQPPQALMIMRKMKW